MRTTALPRRKNWDSSCTLAISFTNWCGTPKTENRKTYYARQVKDIVRYPSGEKISDFHIPTTVEDYRAIYKAYLHDPELQDARAYFPFVPMWDNHEVCWKGCQSFQCF